MDDRAGADEPAAERLRRLVEGGRHRWHAAPDDPALFVLDDGTGNVELRLEPAGDAVRAVLLRRDVPADRFEPAAAETEAAPADAFRRWLDEATDRLLAAAAGAPSAGKGRTRFIASFAPDQLAALRALADREGVAVAEVVRRAVDEYLARAERWR